MAAKVATRSKVTKIDEDGERWVVVNRNTLRRSYFGDGVDEESAKLLAEQMLEPSFAAPIETIVAGKYVDPEAPVAEEAVEAVEEGAEPVAA